MKHQPAGFTLIELVVSVGIMVVLTSVGIAGFLNFQETQTVQTAAYELRQFYVSAQSQARAKDKPGACGSNILSAFQVVRSSNTFTQQALCSSTVDRDSMTIDSTITIAASSPITFQTQYEGTFSEEKVCLSKGSKKYGFTINKLGQVGDVMNGATIGCT